MKITFCALRSVALLLLLCGGLLMIDRYLSWSKKKPTPQQITRYRINKLELLCHEYRDRTGTFPPERFWSRNIVIILSGDSDLINTDIRDSINLFYDAWDRPMRYRFPGVYNPESFDIYSVGPDGQDDGGRNDDIGNWPHN